MYPNIVLKYIGKIRDTKPRCKGKASDPAVGLERMLF